MNSSPNSDPLFSDASAWIHQGLFSRWQRLWPSYFCYFVYLAFHLVAWPILAIHGLRRSRKRGHREIMWTRLLGGSKPLAKFPYGLYGLDESDDGEIGKLPPSILKGRSGEFNSSNKFVPYNPYKNVVLYAGGMGEKRAGLAFAEVLIRERKCPVSVLVQVSNASKIHHSTVPTGIMPYNNPISVLIFLWRWRPKAILGVEFWDNHHLAAICSLLGIPTAIFNCPITEQSIRGMSVRKRWRYQLIGAYCCQGPEHAKRLFQKVKIPNTRIIETGPICIAVDPVQGREETLDQVRNDLKVRLRLPEGAFPVVIAGSTYKEEEVVLLEAFDQIRQECPDAVLVLAPRGVNRPGGCDSVLLEQFREFARWSAGIEVFPDSRIVLIDTTGELKYFYSVGHVAFVGGSMGQHGAGHTPVEAMAWGLPICIGPVHPQQKLLIDLLLENDLATVCKNARELVEFWSCVAKDSSYRENVQRRLGELLEGSDEMILRIYDNLC